MLLTPDLRVWLEAASSERTKQKITLTNIDSVIKKEAAKHGKKSLEYQLIQDMKPKGFNDIAIYTAMALAQTKLLPHWSMSDILGEIENKSYIDKKYHKYLIGKNSGSALDQKKIAMQIWRNIVENEGSRKIKLKDEEGTDIEIKTDEIVDQIKDKNVALAQELTSSGRMQEIEKAILNALSFFEKLEGADSHFKFNKGRYYNFDPETHATTTQYLNAMIGRGEEYTGGPLPIPQEISKILTAYEFDDNVNVFLNNIIDILGKVDKNIMWPESDFPIKSYSDLKKYFKVLHSSEEQKRGEKIIQSYKKKTKEVTKAKAGGFDDEVYNDVIDSGVNKIAGLHRSIEPEQYDKELEKVAEQMLKDNPALVNYIVAAEMINPKFVDVAHKRQVALDELKSILAGRKAERESHLGRKKESWKE